MRTADRSSSPNHHPGSSNTSRAYWELRAEQVMDRVFSPQGGLGTAVAAASEAQESESIEVEVRDAPTAPPWRGRVPLIWLCGGITGLALLSSGLLGLAWRRASQDLRQERTLHLLQAVREWGAAGDRTALRPAAGAAPSGEQAPPPPPNEPWMEQLSELDGGGGTSHRSSGGAVAPLQVPLNGPLQSAAAGQAPPPPLTPLPAASAAGAPELVGVVQSPGRGGSAIFRVNGTFANAGSGESIGSSSWRLLSTNGDSALIERGGVSRRVSIGSGL